jgi:hypothetical protein
MSSLPGSLHPTGARPRRRRGPVVHLRLAGQQRDDQGVRCPVDAPDQGGFAPREPLKMPSGDLFPFAPLCDTLL